MNFLCEDVKKEEFCLFHFYGSDVMWLCAWKEALSNARKYIKELLRIKYALRGIEEGYGMLIKIKFSHDPYGSHLHHQELKRRH